MGRFHCSTHDLEYNSVCPACRDEKAEESREAIVERLSEQTEEFQEHLETLAYKQSNPGDYKCPECLYITLKKGGRRCPVCRASIDKEYWDKVAKEEEEKAKKAREEKERRVQAAEKARKEAEDEAKRARKKQEEKESAEAAGNFIGFLLLVATLLGLWYFYG